MPQSYKEKIKKCAKCGNKFKTFSVAKKFCGETAKTGCSRIEFLNRKRDNYKRNSYKYRPKNKERTAYRRLKLRFIILHRDNFTCQYCGRKSPEVILEVDHIYPKSKGGLSIIDNYRTSCKDCNLGKGDFILNEFK